MTASIPAGPPRLSVPPKFAAPRQLTSAEVGTLRAIADVLIPAAATTRLRPQNQTSTSGWRAPPTPAPTLSTTSPPSWHNSTVLRQTRSTRHCGPCTPTSPGSSRRCRPSWQAPGCSSRPCARGSDIPASGAIPRAWKKQPTRSPTASSNPSSPAAPSTHQTPPARTDTVMRWTKVLNVVECHPDAEAAKVMIRSGARDDARAHLEQHLDESPAARTARRPRAQCQHRPPVQPPGPLCRPVVASSLVIGPGHHGR